MVGHILDGHVASEIQSIALEGVSAMVFGVGKRDFDLALQATGVAVDAWNLEAQNGGMFADGNRAKEAIDAALPVDVGRAAVGAAQAFARLLDVKEGHADVELLFDVMVARYAEAVIQ
jgi:hypothetical protein